MNMEGASAVTEMAEKKLVKWLFTFDAIRFGLWRHLGLPMPASVAFELLDPPADPGIPRPEIDALVYDSRHPERAVAFQCKRVTVRPEVFIWSQPGKMNKLKEGARQSNDTWRVGFHRSVLLVCIVVDGRERAGNFLDRGLSPALAKTIYSRTAALNLRPEVAMAAVEIVQPVDQPIQDAGGICIKLIRPGLQQQQLESLTEWTRRQGGPTY
jgi:hypothetical protein